MSRSARLALAAAALTLLPGLALAQGYRRAVPTEPAAPLSPVFGYLTPPLPLGVDTGGDNDRRPMLPSYQQGGGQQTGGPARNAVPGDRAHFYPR